MTVPFLDLRAAYLELKEEIDAAVQRVVASGSYILGSEVEAFEEAFATYCEAAHCVAVANGLDALHLTLVAMGIGPGDEVIVPSNTFIATWLAVSRCGATIVPVEPQLVGHNIDPARIEAAISDRTKAIIPVHLYGCPADLAPIIELAGRFKLRILEDAAQAHGATYHGRRIGGHGDAAAWSFYPGKNLGAMGDGGAITTNDAELATKLRKLRNYGSSEKYVNELKGFNSRLDPLQAAILTVKLSYLDMWNARRSAVAASYIEALHESGVALPAVEMDRTSSWHLFVVRHRYRDALQRVLSEAGIGALVHYPIPPHRQQAYADLSRNGPELERADGLAREVLSLPIGPHLSTGAVEHVVQTVRGFCRRAGEGA